MRLIAILFVLFLLIPSVAQSTTDGSGYERADADTIEAQTNELLSQPRFKPHKKWWQLLLEKISDWGWGGLDLGEHSGWVSVIVWIIVIWCGLTLLAILSHLIWTIAIMVRNNSPNVSTGRKYQHFKRNDILTIEELRARMLENGQQGKYREALGLMLLLMLRRLDMVKVIRYHQSKSNGDYLREYRHGRGEEKDFRDFLMAFDRTIYGGGRCDKSSYRVMEQLFEAIDRRCCETEEATS